MAKKATVADYIALQGGMPRIENHETSSKLCYVVHGYLNPEIWVTTRKPPSRMGTVFYEIAGRIVEFQTAYVLALHGTPCERTSNSDYKRKGW